MLAHSQTKRSDTIKLLKANNPGFFSGVISLFQGFLENPLMCQTFPSRPTAGPGQRVRHAPEGRLRHRVVGGSRGRHHNWLLHLTTGESSSCYVTRAGVVMEGGEGGLLAGSQLL